MKSRKIKNKIKNTKSAIKNKLTFSKSEKLFLEKYRKAILKKTFDFEKAENRINKKINNYFIRLFSVIKNNFKKISNIDFKNNHKKILQTNYKKLFAAFFKSIKSSSKNYKAFFRKKKFQRIFAGMLAVIVLIGTYFNFTPGTKGATYIWNQTTWAGGADEGTYPDHTDNQTNWTKYSSKDSGVDVGTELELNPTTSSISQASESDFDSGATSNTIVSSGTVKLSSDRTTFDTAGGTDHEGADWSPSDGDTISGIHYNIGTFTVSQGTTVNIETGVVMKIYAQAINIQGTINGNEKGYAGGAGGTGGTWTTNYGGGGTGGSGGTQGGVNGNNGVSGSGYSACGGGGGGAGGGGYGGAGASGSNGTKGDCMYSGNYGTGGAGDSSLHGTGSEYDIDMGAGGGGGGAGGGFYYNSTGANGSNGGSGGSGGAGILLRAEGGLNISGTINANGGAGGIKGNGAARPGGVPGNGGNGGGGSGGGILLDAGTLTLSGTLTANGATNGGGGRIKTFSFSRDLTGSTIQVTGANSGTTSNNNLSYGYSGTFTSSVMDAGQKSNFSTLDFTASIPSNTGLTVDVRAGNVATPDGTWTEWQTNISDGGSIASLSGNQYVQYRANLSSSDVSVTPSLEDITFNYSYYATVSSGTSNVDFGTEENYTQEDASMGTDFENGNVSLAGENDGVVASGGTVTYSGGYTIHTFTSSGTLSVSSAGTVEYLIVAGGGGGGSDNGSTGGGGGGAGGVLSGSTSVTAGNKTVTVGQGGTATYTGQGGSGGNSVFNSLTATGGGGGGMKAVGSSGGSGGGGGGTSAGGSGTSGQGNNGGSAVSPSGGGGGGAGEAGANGTASYGGAGGIGIQSSISGTAIYYGGGGAGASPYATKTPSLGGQGGGGNGGYSSQNATAGATNTGGGGGGATYQSYSAAGGSGIVIVRYLNAHPTSQAYYVTTTDSSQIDTSTYGHITGVTLTQTTPDNTNIKYLVSFDDRSTWKYWDGDSWETSSLDNLQTNGMSKATVEGLSQANWESTGGFVAGSGTLDFAADLSTSDAMTTPELDNIAISYQSLPAYIISSAFNTESSLNALSKIEWTEVLPDSSTDAQIQIQTAADNSGVPGTWSGWKGPDGTSSSYFTDPNGGESMPASFTDQTDDQWIQYRIFLSTTNSGFTPTVSDVSFSYTVNAAPEIQNVTVSQGTDGIVTIGYEVLDPDTDTGATANKVNVALQYCTANCSNSGNETWTNATTVSGHVGEITGIDQTSWLSRTLTWNAATDYDDQYLNNLKVRIKADDSEGANRYGYGTSAAFILDTTDPVPGAHPVLVDASTTPATITLSASDDSSLKMKVGLNADLSDVAEWSDYSTSKELTLASDPDTVYVQFKDVYGNVSSIQSVITPETPTGFMSQDTSNLKINPAEYRLFIAWKMVENPTPGFASYKIYRSTSASGPWTSLARTETDRTINSYGDNTVVYDTHYYYKVKVIDLDGNVSFLSDSVDGNANGIQDVGEGGGGSETTAPTISNVSISNINTTQVTVTWDTNELSNSTVGYSTTQGIFTSETGVATMLNNSAGVGQHRVVLSGLNPNTKYYLQVESEDSADNSGTDNNGGNGYSFTTLSGPVISGVYISDIEGDKATIHWTTNSSSNSYVTYSVNSNLTSNTEVGTNDSVTNHSVQLTGLTSGQKYYFFVKSGISSDNNEENYYSFITSTDPADTTDPTISSVSSSSISDTDAVIKWATNEGATSKVYYGTVSGNLTSYSTLNTNLNFDHAITLTSLTPSTTYYYKVVSADKNNNEATSAEYSFETEESATDSVTEISDISDPPSVLSNNKAVITFKTDNRAQCIIEYGTASGTYGELPVSETSYNVDHSIHLAGLISSSKYYYQIICTDPYDNVVSSDEENFTTTSESTIDEDETVPEVSSVSVGTITGESATITWTTDEDANSLVRYGIVSGELTNIAGDGLIVTSDDYNTDHTVIINNLTPGTKYYYTVFSYDAAGNIGESSEGSFSTKSPSTLSSIKVISTSLSEATITWNTSKSLTSIIEYGLTEEYGETKSSSTTTDTHEVALSGLKTGVIYHFRVKGKDADNNYYSSGDYAFEPKSPPKLSNSSVNSITEHGSIISVNTDIPTDILVTYVNKEDPTDTGSQGKPDFITKHELEITNLKSGSTYSYTVRISDEQGNQTTSEAKEFTTSKDETSPSIDQVKNDSALTQNDKVQTIISWATDEPATTSISYREGMTGEEIQVDSSSSYTNNHIVVITTFKPGTVYYFKTKSIDQSGNETTTQDFALLTPRKKENVVQMIVNNFEDIFGWAKVN